MAESLIEDVSDTAFMVATYRAIESERSDALFRDPLAARVAGEHGRAIVASLPKAAFFGGWSVAIRTCLIDDYVRDAVKHGVTAVLNLGAGLDTRPYRMELPAELLWVEVDYPHVVALKEERLAGERARCRLERVKLDLEDGAARRAVFADVARRAEQVLVLTEGVVPYLSVDAVASLADDLFAEERFRRWIVDYFAAAVHAYRRRQGMARRMVNAPFKFEPKDWVGFFREHGWRVREMRYLVDEAERLGRPVPLPWIAQLWFAVRALFMSAGRRAEARKFAGYALLVR